MGTILLRDVILDGSRKDILIDQGRIRKIGPAGSCAGWRLAGDLEMMDCSGKAAIPGFVNMHTHSPMSLMRGIGGIGLGAVVGMVGMVFVQLWQGMLSAIKERSKDA